MIARHVQPWYYRALFHLKLTFTVGAFTVFMTTFSQAEPNTSYSQQQAIANFWQQGQFENLISFDKTRLAYAIFTAPSHDKGIVISSGRTEAYLKYQELAFDLFTQGYDVFMLDHRGQGLSQRLLTNPHKGYVAHFDDYAQDLAVFIEQIVQAKVSYQPYLLAHSMGSAIAIRYLQRTEQAPINAAVLSSPMIQFSTGAIPLSIAKPVINSMNWLNQQLASESWYFFGQSNYQAQAFEQNPLTQSKTRYQQSIATYQQHPTIQLGGATVHWLQQALTANQAIFEQLNKLTVPLLVIQAGADSIVDNQAQNLFCQQLHKLNPEACPNGKPVIIAHAKHELFIEQDQYRKQALDSALAFFTAH